jgi:AraC-like DNA-binding protein
LRELQGKHGTVLVVVDQPASIGALPLTVARELGCPVAYPPRLTMRRIADLCPGEAETDAKDAFIIADAARAMPHTLRAIEGKDETIAELEMIVGFDDDLAGEATRVANRLHGLLTQVPPSWPTTLTRETGASPEERDLPLVSACCVPGDRMAPLLGWSGRASAWEKQVTVLLTTAEIPDREKVAYWGSAVSRALVPVDVSPCGAGSFEGRMRIGRLGSLRVTTMEADANRMRRTKSLIGPSPDELVGCALQVTGTASLVQDGHRAEVGEGDLVLYDTTRPFSFTYPRRFTAHVFQMPRRVLGVPDEHVRRVSGRAIGTGDGLGAVLRPFLTSLAASVHSCPPSVAHRLAGHVGDLFATLIADRVHPALPAGADTPHGHTVAGVRDYIGRHLGDPSLSPESIAKAHGISVRYLHRLFEGEGVTVSRLIQQRRLEECGRELAHQGGTAPTVSAVARRWGFVSPAHFSRAFRAAYGVSPRQWRELRAAPGD